MIIFETERLRFRRLVPGDIDALYELYRDPEIRKYFPDGVRTYEETQEELEWFLNGHPRHPELGLWAAILKETDEFVGRCGLLPWEIDGVLEVEIAYMIDKRFWRGGLGAEAARGLVDHAFNSLGLTRVIALIDKEHDASLRTAIAAGLKYDKTITMDGCESELYALNR